VTMAKSSLTICSLSASPQRTKVTRAVVGVTPSSSTYSPSKALISALLPELNSPTTTIKNSSSSCKIASFSALNASSGRLKSDRIRFAMLSCCFSCCKKSNCSLLSIVPCIMGSLLPAGIFPPDTQNYTLSKRRANSHPLNI